MCTPSSETNVIAADQLVRKTKLMRHHVGILDRQWYVAARSHQVTGKKPFSAEILEEKIVLFRDPQGSVVAMVDRCLHRNAPLSEGDVFDGCIGCPYHGWTYNKQGEVINIPAEGPDGAKAALQIETFPVLERADLIWVWMGGNDHPPDHEPFPMPHVGDPKWGNYYMETDFDNGVTALVENFMDVPHTVWVHRGWFRSRTRREVNMKVERTEDSVLVTYDQPDDEIGFSRYVLNPKRLPMTHTDRFYMPNVTRVDYLFGEPDNPETGFVITSQCTPVSPFRSRVYTRISYKLGFLNTLALGPVAKLRDDGCGDNWNHWGFGRDAGHVQHIQGTPRVSMVSSASKARRGFWQQALNRGVQSFLHFYTRRVIEQDVDIMRVHGRNLEHYGSRQYVSTPADTLHVFIESLRDWAEQGGHAAKPEPTTQHTTFWI